MGIFSRIRLWHLMPLALLALIAVAASVWLDRSGFSQNDVAIEIIGPVQMEGGQTDTFTILVRNNSTFVLIDANLFVELPSSLAFASGDDFFSEHFERIAAGAFAAVEVELTARTSSEATEIIRVRLDYSPQDINARFVSRTTYDVVVGSLDAAVIFLLPTTVYVGEKIEGSISVQPTSDITHFVLYAKLTVPDELVVEEADPAFDHDTIWRLGTVAVGEKRTMNFSASVRGGEGSIPIRVAFGKFDGISFVPLRVAEITIKISQSPLVIEQRVVRPVAHSPQPGDVVEIEIITTNKSDEALNNISVSVELAPVALIDTATIIADNALQLSAGSIAWTPLSFDRLERLEQGESRAFTLSFTTRLQTDSSTGKIITVQTVATATTDNNTAMRSEDTLPIQLATELEMSRAVVRSSGPFGNTGPVPPRVGELTTYTVSITIEGSLNATRTVRVETVLPAHASWQNAIDPENVNIQFIDTTRTVVWDVGTLVPNQTLVAAFQVGVVPLLDQRGGAINIVERTTLSGVDTFSNSFIEKILGAVLTTLPDDATVSVFEGIVQ